MLSDLFPESGLGDVAIDASIPEFPLTPDGNEGRNVFLTAKEYSGVGLFGSNKPWSGPTIQVGDKVAMFPKFKNSLILRPSADDKDAYKVLGPAFIPYIARNGMLRVKEDCPPLQQIRIV